MAMKLFAAALMASAMIAAPALAQSNSATKSDKQATTAPVVGAATMPKHDLWRLSKFNGLDVYNADNEKIGDINDLITDDSGKINAVVIGVGGFLGIGRHNVGVPWDKVDFVMTPVKTAARASAVSSRVTTGSGAASNAGRDGAAAGPHDYPDHAVVNMTQEQLKALPEFKIASATSSASGPAGAPTKLPPAKPQNR